MVFGRAWAVFGVHREPSFPLCMTPPSNAVFRVAAGVADPRGTAVPGAPRICPNSSAPYVPLCPLCQSPFAPPGGMSQTAAFDRHDPTPSGDDFGGISVDEIS